MDDNRPSGAVLLDAECLDWSINLSILNAWHNAGLFHIPYFFIFESSRQDPSGQHKRSPEPCFQDAAAR